ncbi:hypothetical protein AQUCO_00300142v1 [Aquilegia coerulea]|uniref:Peroxidase n=1 Tax=Aquilegia coerulea TaxID=218851 RepID=A0A2G5EXD7_AQUCA|nr:hypothetical protein AQUCO_00300142v1 [Aquilegia coerulea]
MASSTSSVLSIGLVMVLLTTFSLPAALAQLSVSYYASTCPSVFDTVRSATRSVINRDGRMGASILCLFFHDCFVSGCDGGILLSGGERNAPGNIAMVRGLIEHAISSRDSIVQLGGPSYAVPLGRRDTRTPNIAGARSDLPAFFHDLPRIINIFQGKGFSEREMVALSGAHSIGQARCSSFRDRIYSNTSNIDPAFAVSRQATCPRSGGDGNLAPLDPQSPGRFGNNYFQALMNRRGLLNSDQVLFNGGSTDSIVRTYANAASAFSTDFMNAMVKMGNLSPLTGTQGEIRTTCQRVN